MLRLRFLFLDNNNKKPMSLPVKAFVISQGKKSGSMRGPRTSAPPTPKVKPPKRAKFLEDCVHLVSCDIYKERKFIILNTVRTQLTGFIDESTLMQPCLARHGGDKVDIRLRFEGFFDCERPDLDCSDPGLFGQYFGPPPRLRHKRRRTTSSRVLI